MFSIEGATYIYRPIDGFAKLGFVGVFKVGEATYIYRQIDSFAKVVFL
jgi:hypothetical protein